MMKLCHAFAAIALFATSPVFAAEAGVINQAGPYEQTLKFYMHPAHLFFSSQAPRVGQHPAVLIKARTAHATAVDAAPVVRIHPALVVRPAHQPLVASAD